MGRNLSDSKIFKEMVITTSSVKKAVKDTMANLDEAKVDPAAIASEINTIETRMSYSTKIPLMNLYNEGRLVILNNKDLLDLPVYLNVLPAQDKSNKTFVLLDITKYTSNRKSISVNTLYGILQNGLTTYELTENWSKYTSNGSLMERGATMYALLGIKVLDKLYAINMDTVEADFLGFLLAKFFLVAMAQRGSSSNTDNIAYKSCFHGTSMKLIKEKEENINPDGKLYEGLVTLLTRVNEDPKHKIKFRDYFQNYVRMYGDTTVLSMDYMPAFFHLINSVAVSANLNKEYAIENTVDRRNITKFHSEFSRLI